MHSTLTESTLSISSLQHSSFFEMLNVPIFCNVLWSSQSAAQSCAKGDITLTCAPDSSLIYNSAFDPARLEYTQAYENALDFSPRFQQYIRELAQDLIERHQLRHKTIIEIGCGKGDFLLLLAELGDNCGIGFDPSYIPRPIPEALQEQIVFIPDYYSGQYADEPADFIACRHTLEHIPNPLAFLKTLRQLLGDRAQTQLFFEVPNALDTFQNLAVWDIIYEHCNYFTPDSLTHLFTAAGFQVQRVTETYAGQFLCIEAIPGEIPSEPLAPPNLQALSTELASFTARFQAKVQTWQTRLAEWSAQGKRVAVWGAGSKGATFLNLLPSQGAIAYIVDVNPRKEGKFVPGTGHPIVSPNFLPQSPPDIVLVMNPVYLEEIRTMLQNLGLAPELFSV